MNYNNQLICQKSHFQYKFRLLRNDNSTSKQNIVEHRDFLPASQDTQTLTVLTVQSYRATDTYTHILLLYYRTKVSPLH